MKIVFSRKGFDSSSGGSPSPIIDGRPVSIPIPAQDRSETTYNDLGLGEIVERMTNGRHTGGSLCHNDPMFEPGTCYFGQTSSAQSHLRNSNVGLGDVFLFFGLFANQDGSDRHHRIFGYLNVDGMVQLGSTPQLKEPLCGLRHRHPHTLGSWNDNNTVYFGAGNTAKSATEELRLSKPGENVSVWKVPKWLKGAGLTFHHDPKWWLALDTLQTVGRGQEFVTDISGCSDARRWLNKILKLIER